MCKDSKGGWDFSKGWKPYEGGNIPSKIPVDLKLTSTKVDGKKVYLAGSFQTVEFLEENGAVPLGWKVYEGGKITSEIPKEILDAGMLKVRERGGKQVLLVAPDAVSFVEDCKYTLVKD